MRQIMLFFSFFLSLLVPSSNCLKYESIQFSFRDSNMIELIRDGKSIMFSKGSSSYNEILYKFEKMVENSFQMPAFGVSIDELTREEMKKGIWLEFKFGHIGYNSEMPFSSLLVEVNEDYYGFNVIRKYEGKYDGRCYYISLNDNNMDNLYMFLLNI